MSGDIERWLKAGRHLPLPMRDFHDAKALFKTMHHRMARSMDERSDGIGPEVPDWIQGQCYVVDFFLHFMARRGWTLQRTRADLPFRDLEADIAEMDAEVSKAFAEMLRTKGDGK